MVYCFFAMCLLLWSVDISRASTVSIPELQCASPKTMNFKLSVTSLRNQTGHWIAQAQLEHKIDQGNTQDTAPIEIDIDQTVRKCDNGESVLVVATVTAPPVIGAKRRPSSNYDLIPGFGYYKMHTVFKTWPQALNACRQESAHLLIVNSEAEVKAIKHLWAPRPKVGDWRDTWSYIGIHDQFEEGKYITIFSEPLNETGYSKWSSEPSDQGERCGMVNIQGEFGDVNCAAPMSFICEQEL